MGKYFIAFQLLVFSCSCFSQGDTSRFCNPQLEGMARSKGFNISYERVFSTHIVSESMDTTQIRNSSDDISSNNKFEVFLRFPVWNRPGLKIITGIKYYFEEFNFDESEKINYDLYKNLHDKNLKSLGLNLNVLKPLNPVSYVGIRVLGEFNGDYTTEDFPKKSFLKYSFAFIYGRKPCPTRAWGLGVYYSYTFGRRSIYPVILYSNTINEKWGLESLLPANLKFRRNFSEKSLLYLGYEIEGGAYHLQFVNPPLGLIRDLELRRSNLRLQATFEREIHDWLWFGVSSGIRVPINFKLARQFENDPLIQTYLETAPFINLNIFIVPPRTIENKIMNMKE